MRPGDSAYGGYALARPAAMQIYWNKRKCLHKKRVELSQDWFGTTTKPPCHCFRTPIRLPRRRVYTLYQVSGTHRYHSLVGATK